MVWVQNLYEKIKYLKTINPKYSTFRDLFCFLNQKNKQKHLFHLC